MLRICLLGEQTVIDDADGRALIESARAMALVGHLVLHAGTPQPRAAVAAALWPDSTGAQSLTNLRRELHHLRRTLTDECGLDVTRRSLGWHETARCRVDLLEFRRECAAALAPGVPDHDRVEHGLAALAAHGGELLPGLYDEWVLDARGELGRTCVELCRSVGEAARRSGHLEIAIQVARRRVRLEPLDERGHRFLMEVLAESGDRAGAVSAYHHCASVIESELGVDPDPSTTECLHRLLGSASHRRVPGRRPPPFVGRAGELTLLHDLWQRTGPGSPRVVAVRGAPGVGKTRLVAELVRLVRDTATVATARCFDVAGQASLAPVAAWVGEPAIRAATSAVPTPDAGGRHLLFHELAAAVSAPGRPTCLVLDNLHWCDPDTLSFLTYLLLQPPPIPLLLALTMRRERHQRARAAERWLARVGEAGLLTTVDLPPLDDAETRTLVDGVRGTGADEQQASRLHAATGGLPLLVIEAARAADDNPSVERLDEVLRLRFEQVSPEAREVAGLAAAVGREFSLRLLTEASDLGAEVVVTAVDELWQHHILQEVADAYDFTHDLLRDAAYDAVSPPRRWLLHRRLAQALELVSAGRFDGVAPQLAEQYWRAGNHDRALTFLDLAADLATRRYAQGDLVRLGRTRRDLLRRLPASRDRDLRELDCLRQLTPALTAVLGYAAPELQDTHERCLDLARRLGSDDAAITAMIGLWSCGFVQGRNREAHAIALELADLVSTGHRLAGQARFSLAGTALHLGDPRRALAGFDAACDALGDESLVTGTRAWVHARGWSAHAAWLTGDPAGAAARASEAVVRAEQAGHPYSHAVALAYSALTHQLLGDREAILGETASLARLCARHEFAYYNEWATLLGAWASAGQDDAAEAHRAVERLQAQGAFARAPYWLGLVAELDAGRGAVATLDAALVAARARDDRWWLPELLRLRARHDPAEAARARLSEAAALARQQGSRALLERCEQSLAVLA